ncbi:MAG: YHS domain-containing (seleno)protein [Bacteroidota bacterium]
MKSLSILILSSLFLVACSSDSSDKKDQIFNSNGIAIDGYDVVAYHEQNEAKKGTESESVNYEGFTYLFSSTKNRVLFEENPDKYLPKYGGWCAYAVAETSTKMSPDPTEWQIQDGELQLFTSSWMTKLTGSLKDDWNEDPKDFKNRADQNWNKIK